MAKTLFELSVDVLKLEASLVDVAVGVTISYQFLSGLIGRDVAHGARGVLTSARKRLMREPHRVFFGAVRGVGLRRLTARGMLTGGKAHLVRSSNQARYSERIVTAVEYDDLTADERIQHNVLLSQAGVIRHVASTRTSQKLRVALTEAKKTLALSECIEAMKPLL